MEILPNGLVDNFSHQNNWETPKSRQTDNCLVEVGGGPLFALRVQQGQQVNAVLLQTEPLGDYPVMESIDFEGKFPLAHLRYYHPDQPAQVDLHAYSSFQVGNAQASGIPGCVFSFTIENTSKTSQNVSLLAAWPNTIGNWLTTRYNELFEEDGLVGFSMNQRNPFPGDPMYGDMTLAVEKNVGDVSYDSQWYNKTFPVDMPPDKGLWQGFVQNGTLSNDATAVELTGGAQISRAVLCVQKELQPGEQWQVPFFASWYMPNHHLGHMYENWFSDSRAVAQHLAANRSFVLKRIQDWHGILENDAIPAWLSDALINSLYVLFSSTLWGKENEFTVFESPIWCPLMSTLDLRFYYSWMICLLFPELERVETEHYLRIQRPDGYVPHDLGHSRID